MHLFGGSLREVRSCAGPAMWAVTPTAGAKRLVVAAVWTGLIFAFVPGDFRAFCLSRFRLQSRILDPRVNQEGLGRPWRSDLAGRAGAGAPALENRILGCCVRRRAIFLRYAVGLNPGSTDSGDASRAREKSSRDRLQAAAGEQS